MSARSERQKYVVNDEEGGGGASTVVSLSPGISEISSQQEKGQFTS